MDVQQVEGNHPLVVLPEVEDIFPDLLQAVKACLNAFENRGTVDRLNFLKPDDPLKSFQLI